MFLAACAWFGYRASHAGLASGFVDPVSRFGAQDEATYSRVVLEMLRSGDWLTPTFLDRFAYFKPPLLYWLSALSACIFGVSTFALRLPSLLASAGACTLSFSFVASRRGVWSGLLAALLIATSAYWITLGSLNMMDALLAFCSLAMVIVVECDSTFARWRTILLAGLALGAAVLDKSVAGLMPGIAVVLYAFWTRVRLSRIALLLSVSMVVAAPWFLYAASVNFEWLWREHFLTEVFGNSVGAGPISTSENNLMFYARRLFVGDPLIAWTGTCTVAWWIVSRRARGPLLWWVAFSGLIPLLFRYHAASYLLPLITGLAVVAGLAVPHRAAVLTCVLALLMAGFLLSANTALIWRGTNVSAAPALADYCRAARGNPLMVIAVDDEFYSAALPLTHVSYGLFNVGRAAAAGHLPIDWRATGVIVTADEFERRGETWQRFRSELDRLHLPRSLDPRGTVVLFSGRPKIEQTIRRHPEMDFLVPVDYGAGAEGHQAIPAGHDSVLLLGSVAVEPAPRGWKWPCQL